MKIMESTRERVAANVINTFAVVMIVTVVFVTISAIGLGTMFYMSK